MNLLAALLLGIFEPACLQALEQMDPHSGGACVSVKLEEGEYWPTDGPLMTRQGLRDGAQTWIGQVSDGCLLAHRILDSRGVFSFACLGTEQGVRS